MIVMDIFSKFVVFYPLKFANSKNIINKILNEYIPIMGKPKAILSDNGKAFISKFWASVWANEGVKLKYSAVYTPTSNPAERPLKEVGRIVRTYCHKKHTNWFSYLPLVARWINITINESTGFSPFELHHGRKPESEISQLIQLPPTDNTTINRDHMFVLARERMARKAAKRQNLANSTGTPIVFENGDLVLMKSHRLSSTQNKEISKFFLVYQGPYKVLKRIGPSTYSISEIDKEVQIAIHNIRNLKPYIAPVKQLLSSKSALRNAINSKEHGQQHGRHRCDSGKMCTHRMDTLWVSQPGVVHFLNIGGVASTSFVLAAESQDANLSGATFGTIGAKGTKLFKTVRARCILFHHKTITMAASPLLWTL
ncbi:hypothetical protein B566_EDAN004058 [Ephemera danica]|nr:hypothetical protein B566_EDAN004058 [Ephemera danica]